MLEHRIQNQPKPENRIKTGSRGFNPTHDREYDLWRKQETARLLQGR